jgi:hypothetical protein
VTSRDLLDHGAVLARQLAGALGARVVLVRGDLHLERPLAAGGRRACDPAVKAFQGHRLGAAGDAQPLDHLRHGADRGEVLAAAGDQEDALLLADVDRQGRGHAWEDDRVFDRDQGQGLHRLHPLHLLIHRL